MKLTPTGRIVIITLLVIAFYFTLTLAIYTEFTTKLAGANDFYSRWVGSQALLLKSENPYSDQVTREIQMGMYGHLVPADEDQVAFAYPLYVSFFIAPLVTLTYAQAQAFWMAVLIFAVVFGVMFLARWYRFPRQPIQFALLMVALLMFYPILRGIFLGQVTLLAFTFLALAFWSIHRNADVAAGILLAFATVKPQPAVFLVPVVIAWAARHRRVKIVGSAMGTGLVLMVIGILLVTPWIVSFFEAMQNYAQYIPIGPPVQSVSQWLMPDAWFLLTIILILILVGWMAWTVFRNLNLSWDEFQPTLGLVALVTTLMAGRIASPDQTLLLILWFYWLSAWLRDKQYALAAIMTAVILFAPWVVFFLTLRGNTESVVVTVILPLLTLAVYVWKEIASRFSGSSSHARPCGGRGAASAQ